jgi:hypothetical protein
MNLHLRLLLCVIDAGFLNSLGGLRLHLRGRGDEIANRVADGLLDRVSDTIALIPGLTITLFEGWSNWINKYCEPYGHNLLWSPCLFRSWRARDPLASWSRRDAHAVV